MKKLLLALSLLPAIGGYAYGGSTWHEVDESSAPKNVRLQSPSKYLVYTLDDLTMRLTLWGAPSDYEHAINLQLPMPDGTMRTFKVWETPMMPGDLAKKYPGIRTFTGEAEHNPMVTAKIDYTLYGFSAMIYDGENTSFIDPYDNYSDGYYLVHYKRDETRKAGQSWHCHVGDEATDVPTEEEMMPVKSSTQTAQKTVNGNTLRTYRLALSCSNQYAQAATGLSSPTIAQVLSKMTTTMNRVNGVYNREFAVQMNFCSQEDTIIWTTATGSVNGADPFNSINSSGSSCLTQNQTTCNARIGSANYDVGHVFTTGGGGISSLGVVCNNSQKAKSVTGLPSPVGDGFDIDYVAHEMGHEYGSQHTFNNNQDGSCGGNAVNNFAYEPSSGSTILAYAGICSPDDIQPHSNDYFHASSLVQIQSKLAGSENACAVKTSTGNKLTYMPTFSANYTIPYKTPFELTAPTAVDSVADTMVSYCWEQWNLGGTSEFGKRLRNTYVKGPIFRSYSPLVYNETRVFPKLSMILSGNLTNVTASGSLGEKAPDTARYLTFKLTVRNIMAGYGCFLFLDDTIHINAVSTGAANSYGGFKVTSQDTAGVVFNGGSSYAVTWNVVGTNAAPVSCDSVIIYMSRDGGTSWADTLGTYANSGMATVTVPTVSATTSTCRFKVKAKGNVFFNVNLKNFKVMSGPAAVTELSGGKTAEVRVYPIPAHDVLHIAGDNARVSIYNVNGQMMWEGPTGASTEISVSTWAKGMYFVRVANTNGTVVSTKTVTIQ